METKDQLEIIKMLLYIITGLIGICGGFISYIFGRHTKDNDCAERENREDHKIIFDRLEKKQDKE